MEQGARERAAERTAGSGGQPVLLFDGECAFCTGCVEWLSRRLRRPVRLVPWQRTDPRAYGLTRDLAAKSVWWIEPSGRRFSAHRAVSQALLACRPPWSWLGGLFRVPGIRALGDRAYRGVARRRGRLPGPTPACARSAQEWQATSGGVAADESGRRRV